MILRMRLNRWSDLNAVIGQVQIPVRVGKSIGYMEVYESVEDMRKEYPRENEFIGIQEKMPDEN